MGQSNLLGSQKAQLLDTTRATKKLTNFHSVEAMLSRMTSSVPRNILAEEAPRLRDRAEKTASDIEDTRALMKNLTGERDRWRSYLEKAVESPYVSSNASKNGKVNEKQISPLSKRGKERSKGTTRPKTSPYVSNSEYNAIKTSFPAAVGTTSRSKRKVKGTGREEFDPLIHRGVSPKRPKVANKGKSKKHRGGGGVGVSPKQKFMGNRKK